MIQIWANINQLLNEWFNRLTLEVFYSFNNPLQKLGSLQSMQLPWTHMPAFFFSLHQVQKKF